MVLKYTHMYSGEDGLTHFKDVELEGKTGELSFAVSSDTFPATGAFFRETAGQYDTTWHVTPRKMFVVVLEGGLEIFASDGTSRVFRAGDIFLQDDLTGKGHYTKPLDAKPRRTFFVTFD